MSALEFCQPVSRMGGLEQTAAVCGTRRHVPFQLVLARTVVLFLLVLSPTLATEELGEGHNQPFGSGRPSHPIDEVQGFPDPASFFENYVFASKPLKMTNAASISPAFRLWTDDYLMSVEIPPDTDSRVTVETKKKENRTAKVVAMEFKEFLKIYNNSNFYMVHEVPKFIRRDVVLPCPLQCEDMVNEDLVEAMMWFSSGGTKSVVHTDSVDNINCLFRGEKQFVMVDPHKYKDYVDLDHPEGSYSGIDVDRMDYHKYPGLAKVEYHHVSMVAGDCLFIPYLWIHQVRSQGSNLAVNLWWDHYKSLKLDVGKCNARCNAAMTLDSITFKGFGAQSEIGTIKDHVSSILRTAETVNAEGLLRFLLGDKLQHGPLQDPEVFKDFWGMMAQVVGVLDANKDGFLDKEEVKSASDEAWTEVRDRILEMEQLEEEIAMSDGEEGEEIEEEEDDPYGLLETEDSQQENPQQRDEL